MIHENISMLDGILIESHKKSVHEGIVLGMEDSFKMLNQFLDTKKARGQEETISRLELKAMFETYIDLTKKGFGV